MLKKRVLSAIVGISLLILIFNSGGLPFLLLNLVVVLLGINEYLNLIRHKFPYGNKWLASLAGIVLLLTIYLKQDREIIYFILIVTLLLTFIYQLFKDGVEDAVLNTTFTYFSFFYIAGLFGHLLLLAQIDFGINIHNQLILWLPILATWATDTGAYFTGLHLGRRPLAPKVSPNKTIEGAIGGFFSCLIVTLLFSIYLGFGYINGIFLGGLIGVFAQLGDLTVSSFKRDVEVKDSGDLIPGHGGILDRIDSLLFSIPLAYYYIQLIILG